MKSLNVAEFKAHLSEYLESVESGEEVMLCRRNVPIAKISPILLPRKNRTKLGWCKGKISIDCDLTEPAIPIEDWDALNPGRPGNFFPND